jgi:RHS repeat-associated protein
MSKFARAALRSLSALLLLASSANALAQTMEWGEEYAKRSKAAQQISPLGDDAFGDNLSLYNGSVTFTATDISIPGNNALPVELSRYYVPSDASYPRTFWSWDLDVPHVSAVHAYDSTSGWTPAPGQVTNGSGVVFNREDYWSGNQFHIRGGGGDLLLGAPTDPKRVKPTNGMTINASTKDGWFFTYVANGAQNGPGSALVGYAPNGNKYTFDWLVERSYPAIRHPFKTVQPPLTTLLGRKKVMLFVSKIEDRFGNWVRYEWAGSQLNRIYSNDGREIVLAYPSGTEVAATANGKTWTYRSAYFYPMAELASVTNPDGSRWQYVSAGERLDAIDYVKDGTSFIREDELDCSPANKMTGLTATYTVTHPAGAVAAFTFKGTRHGRTNVKHQCRVWGEDDQNASNAYPTYQDVNSLQSKQVSGAGLTPATYSYSYTSLTQGYEPAWGGTPPPHYKTVTVTEPDGTQQVHTFGKDWELNDGQLISGETRKAGVTYKTVANSYVTDAEAATAAFPASMGGNGVLFADDLPNANRPLKATTTTLLVPAAPSTTFTRSITSFDPLARALSVTKSSSLGYARTDGTEYFDETTKWVLGQVEKTTVDGVEVSRTEFDASAQPWKIYDFTLLKHTLTYNTASGLVDPEAGTLKTVADGNNNVTTLSTWKRGIPQLISYADGESESAVVNNDGTIASVTDENGTGYTTSYTYDLMGRLKTITYPAGEGWTDTNLSFAPTTTTTTAYGVPVGLWKQTVSTGVGIKAVYFDAMWRPVVEESFDNTNGTTAGDTRSVSVKRYDASGHPVFQSYPLNTLGSYTDATLKGSRTTFDALDRVTRVEQDDEPGEAPLVTETKYLSGFRTEVTNPRLYKTTTSYMAYDQPSTDWPMAIAHPEGAYTDITRDVYGKPLSVTRRNASGSTKITRSYLYGGAQRLCIVTEPETGSTVSVFDGADNLSWSASGLVIPSGTSCADAKTLASASGRMVNRTYDARNRVASLSFPDGRGNQTWNYTPDGLPDQVTAYNATANGDPVTTAYDYNKRRLLTREHLLERNWAISYGYNANGHQASITQPGGEIISYAPNALGQATKATSATANYATGVSYFPNGAIERFTYGNNLIHELTQNTRGLPDRSRDYGATVALDDSYLYDANGNVAAISDALAGNRGDRDMTYDGLDRLTRAESRMFGTTTAGAAAYSYDDLDNLTRVTINTTDQVAGRDHTYVYDTKWRLTNVTNTVGGASVIGLSYDEQGNLDNKNGQLFDFDFGNRLREATGKETYQYDAAGRRVLASSVALGDIRSHYGQDGVLRYQQDDRQDKVFNYIYLGGSLIAIRETPFGTSTNTIKYQHTDALGSPVAVTDAAGTVLAGRSEYEPFGKVLSATLKDGPGFTGHVLDKATGLNYMQQRYYDPGIGRFLSVDPVTVNGNTGANFNRYKYAANNPFRFTDPDGRAERLSVGTWDQIYASANAFEMPGYYAITGHSWAGHWAMDYSKTREGYRLDAQTLIDTSPGLREGQSIFLGICSVGLTGFAQQVADLNKGAVIAPMGFTMYPSTVSNDARPTYQPGDPVKLTVNTKADGTGASSGFRMFVPGGSGPVGPTIKSITYDPKSNNLTLRYGAAETGTRINKVQVIDLDKKK